MPEREQQIKQQTAQPVEKTTDEPTRAEVIIRRANKLRELDKQREKTQVVTQETLQKQFVI